MIENCFSSTFYTLCLSLTNILHLFLGGSFLINSGHSNHLQITPGQSNVMYNVSCDLYFIFRLYSVLPWSFHCSKVFIPHGKLDFLTHQVCSLILWALFYRAADFECTLPQVVHSKVFSMFLPSLRMRFFVGVTRKTTPQAAHQNIVWTSKSTV